MCPDYFLFLIFIDKNVLTQIPCSDCKPLWDMIQDRSLTDIEPPTSTRKFPHNTPDGKV